MNTIQIRERLQNINSFIGVFAANEIPTNPPINSSLICNTDDNTEPGQHWVGVHYSEKKQMKTTTFFDSYGLNYNMYGLDIPNVRIWNDHQLQSLDSAACGYYCIYFVMMKHMGYDMNAIIQAFSQNDFHYNDRLVIDVVNTMTTMTPVTRSIPCNQSCVCWDEKCLIYQ